jgi:zinc transporter 1/2/3
LFGAAFICQTARGEIALEPLTTKLVFLLAILAAGWLGAALPLLRSSSPQGGRFMSWGNAFSAGIFLGIGLIHMLFEAQEAWAALGWTYPIAFVLATAAFATSLLFEHVLLPEQAHAMVHHHGHDCVEEHHASSESDGLFPYVLIVALSLHSILAGVALGTQDSVSNGLIIFLAIFVHKATAGFALGVSLARSTIERRRSLRLVALFAAMTPAGILVGMSLDRAVLSSSEAYLDATVLALAAGTFIYIASLDIIQDEFLRPGSRFMKWLFATLGLALMALLALWI